MSIEAVTTFHVYSRSGNGRSISQLVRVSSRGQVLGGRWQALDPSTDYIQPADQREAFNPMAYDRVVVLNDGDRPRGQSTMAALLG
jgi:hypothetical protein